MLRVGFAVTLLAVMAGCTASGTAYFGNNPNQRDASVTDSMVPSLDGSMDMDAGMITPPPAPPTCDAIVEAATPHANTAAATSAMESIAANGLTQNADDTLDSFYRQTSQGELNLFFRTYFAGGNHLVTDHIEGYGYAVLTVYTYDSALMDKIREAFRHGMLAHAAQVLGPGTGDVATALGNADVMNSVMNALRVLSYVAWRDVRPCAARDLTDAATSWVGAHNELRQSEVESTNLAIIRSQLWRDYRDAAEVHPGLRYDVPKVLHLTGAYLKIWKQYGILIHDNTRFSPRQLAKIDELLSQIPRELLALRNISQTELLGDNTGFWIHRFRNYSGINIFNLNVGAASENSFPPDTAVEKVDLFMSALAHECNHVVDQWYIEPDPARKARKDTMLARAGAQDNQYLRSQVTAAYFMMYTAEFVASNANIWFTDSDHALALALQRFDQGYREPLNQFLWFADLYSVGGNTTTFYRIDTDANVTVTHPAITRGVGGNVNGITTAAGAYTFTLDGNGFVTGYQAP